MLLNQAARARGPKETAELQRIFTAAGLQSSLPRDIKLGHSIDVKNKKVNYVNAFSSKEVSEDVSEH